jgi:hypothetical protein
LILDDQHEQPVSGDVAARNRAATGKPQADG